MNVPAQRTLFDRQARQSEVAEFPRRGRPETYPMRDPLGCHFPRSTTKTILKALMPDLTVFGMMRNMQTESALIVLLAYACTTTSAAVAQQPAILEDRGGLSNPTGQSSASRQPAGEAVVYVYRLARRAVDTYPLVFVSDDFLVELHRSIYAQRTVPKGTVVVTASQYYTRSAVLLGWGAHSFRLPSSVHGCEEWNTEWNTGNTGTA